RGNLTEAPAYAPIQSNNDKIGTRIALLYLSPDFPAEILLVQERITGLLQIFRDSDSTEPTCSTGDKIMRISKLPLCAFLSLLMLVGCSAARDDVTIGEAIDDTVITSRVKAALVQDEELSA